MIERKPQSVKRIIDLVDQLDAIETELRSIIFSNMEIVPGILLKLDFDIPYGYYKQLATELREHIDLMK